MRIAEVDPIVRAHKESLASADVAIWSGPHNYSSSEEAYSPSVAYPEYPFTSATATERPNHAYEGVRDTLRLLGLDVNGYGQREWNPLGAIIHPGDTVVLKPNFIREMRETQPGHGDCLITHGSVIRAALDYVYIALQGEGRIIIADAPQNDADFVAIRRIAGLDEIQEFYRRQRSFNVEVYDLRPQKARKVKGVIVGHERLPGDPAGYMSVNLGQCSMFSEIPHLCHLLYGAEYDTRELRSHHHGALHEYLIAKTLLDADCVINLPKLKTHKKTGITVCLKNLVGINGNKNWLPHHREGTPCQGGDQFADDSMTHRVERKVMIGFRRLFPLLGPIRGILAKPCKALGRKIFGDTNTDTIRSGNWYGNDTTWRMVLDLNRVLLYADKDGQIRNHPTRSVFCVVDGIVGGEGNGPLDPDPKPAGMILAGANSVAVDLASARLMGMDYRRLPMLCQSLADHRLPLTTFGCEAITCRSNAAVFNRPLQQCEGTQLAFTPHFGWRGHVELSCV